MNKSEFIDKLAQALSKLQSEIQNAYKDKSGYGYKYAELSSILDLSRPVLAKNELAISQLCDNGGVDPDVVGVETLLMHSSGQYISSTLYMRVTAAKGMTSAQAAGSVITYARRYALAAILGIAQTDDDASVQEPAASKQSFNKPIAKKVETINELEMLELQSLADASDSKLEDICKHYGISALIYLPKDKLPQLMTQLQRKIEKKEHFEEEK